MEPEQLFSFQWYPTAVGPNADDAKEHPTLVEFKLDRMGDGTLLRVTESGFDALPPAGRDEAFRRNDDGWTGQMMNIQAYVTKNP
jgi:hypothetical protein